MGEQTVLDDFLGEVRSLTGCCLGQAEASMLSSAVEIIAWVPSVPDEEGGAALVRLDSGKFATMEESQDYTGHG